MVQTEIQFCCEGQRWVRCFHVESGCTILELKEKMLDPPGTQEDVDSFELRQLSRRVPDFEKIEAGCGDHTFDFEYLGPGVGASLAREDQRCKEEWERQLTQASHGRSLQAASVLPRSAPQRATASSVVVTIDTVIELTAEVVVQGGDTVLHVKKYLAAQDPMGMMKVEDFGLAVLAPESGSDKEVPALPDSTVLTREHLLLQTTDRPCDEPPEASPEITETTRDQPSPSAAATAVVEEDLVPKVRPAPRPKGAEKPGKVLPCWEVVGGAEKGGIIVRDGQKTSSTQLQDRLATGAVIEQLRLEGERLCYKKLSGVGPDTGWVSLSVSGKELVVPRKVEAFPLERALSLQEELMEGFAQPEFQRALLAIIKDSPDRGLQFKKKQSLLFLTVQSAVLPRYGFEGTQAGVFEMVRAFAPHQVPEVEWNNGELSKLLRL